MKVVELKFDSNGLIPAIVQDHISKKVLMLAYMNKESLEITIKEGKTCFYSRSRQCLWRKGETSGNTQQVVSIRTDCDRDTLLIDVIKAGPACHTGSETCFFEDIVAPEQEDFSYENLYKMLVGRKVEKKEGSYTTYLFEKGTDKILKKVGEECTEVIIAAKGGDKAETVFEIADLLYHIMVMMIDAGITLDEVTAELAKRHIVDHKVKQEKMQ
ncbi:MAG: bifunctional phosphoribosyl-AMP cyclohydrolase/phosphoribosyl-ATP diphosphatase HisIE [Oscillospiraceae bacterium]|nr:bifunctional phosphoribosyl-AMP cyclohydrolase/phosphoribosyl-ATP diphosphatase HisIE [Clostridiaceae bacterium]MDO4495639.1 bifunctional phosphoribosyl-AMP cyclohydrolase/phosphoribosyl-ATP diphosphatase HisIE [Clostridiaceae bacterium]MDY5948643.1 bifunctional phosphoribosyl-AMP cyclohydrolase/phosphoribosyl-ATP diphosphatase HisIE [Oscillospiraceae bacterium]